jgi:hypothetical protein
VLECKLKGNGGNIPDKIGKYGIELVFTILAYNQMLNKKNKKDSNATTTTTTNAANALTIPPIKSVVDDAMVERIKSILNRFLVGGDDKIWKDIKIATQMRKKVIESAVSSKQG